MNTETPRIRFGSAARLATVLLAASVLAACAAPQAPHASGTQSADLPTVTENADGAPVVEFPDTDPPDTAQTVELAVGDGPVVEDGDDLTIHYQVSHWESGTTLTSTWEDETIPFSTETGISRIADALVGATVGSRLLLVLPPDADSESNEIPAHDVEADDTLVVLVEIQAIR